MSSRRSRMDIQSEDKFQIFHCNDHFYQYINQAIDEKNINEEAVIKVLKEYTNNKYIQMNGYLRKGDYTMDYRSGITSIFLLGLPMMLYLNNLASIKSLYLGLQGKIKIKNLTNINEGTIVYRGIKIKPPSSLKVGDQFYLAEFVSTSLDINVAKGMGQYIFVITLYGKGFKGVDKLSYYPGEKEVLINAYSKFKITKISGNYYYMDRY